MGRVDLPKSTKMAMAAWNPAPLPSRGDPYYPTQQNKRRPSGRLFVIRPNEQQQAGLQAHYGRHRVNITHHAQNLHAINS
ncbi:MAG: hypothetical protein ACOYB3_16670, partial [Azonexus sp.]